MPVVAVERPIEHHQATRQTAIGDGLAQAKALAGLLKRRGEQRLVGERMRGGVARQLAHHHPGRGLNRLLLKEGVGAHPRSTGGAGLIPDLLRFPTPAKGEIQQRQQITSVAAVDQHAAGKPLALAVPLNREGVHQTLRALHRQRAAAGQPAQIGEGCDPILEQCFGLRWSKTKTAHPVLIKASRLRLSQPSQKGTPKPRLPGTELIAIRAAHPRGADHAAQPRSWGQQDGVCSRAGRLDRRSDTTGSAAPDHHRGGIAVGRHGGVEQSAQGRN